MKRPLDLNGEFKGWYVIEDEGVIYDADGNFYYLNEIRAIFYYRQLQKTVIGTKEDIISLRQILEEKTEMLSVT